jgi:type IV fimbrial biogenesis protein FimT
MCRKDAGFTLVEAVIALAVAALLLALAIPAWTNALAAVHIGKVRSALNETFVDAVRHATVTGAETVICSSAGADRCSGSVDWSRGWIVFADLDGDRSHDANETLVRHEPPLKGGVHLRSTQGRTRLIIQPNGGNGGSNVTFTLCDGRGSAKATTLVLSNTGRMRQGIPAPAAASECVHGG